MSSKRKAVNTSPNVESPLPKRRRGPPAVEAETAEATTTLGLELLDQLRERRDRKHRVITTEFLHLVDKDDFPEYYVVTRMPLALDTIQDKLERHEYPTLTALESDLLRMVENATDFNERRSDIATNATRIGKFVTDYMRTINPSYLNDPKYEPFPTPIPDNHPPRKSIPDRDAAGKNGETKEEPDRMEASKKTRRSVILHGPSAEKEATRRRATSTPAITGAADAGESFEGNTFQQAQEKIVTEMINLKPTSEEFLNLPPRSYKDYYSVVLQPACLKGVHKQVLGIKGREQATGVSFFKSWQSFEEQMSMIWNNARFYNEDGSDIYAAATKLEAYFKKRMIEAKAAVSEPSQPRVKLRMSVKAPETAPKITLRVGNKEAEDTASSVTGVTVDAEALKRQQDLVKAGTNGHIAEPNTGAKERPPSRNPSDGSRSDSVPTLNGLTQDRTSASAGSPLPPANGVKREASLVKSPTLPATIIKQDSTASNGVPPVSQPLPNTMPPPSGVLPRLPGGTPLPQATHVPHINHMTNPLDSRWRQPGKDATDALISNISIATHPSIKVQRRFKLDIPPSATLSQQSLTINLPASHYCLHVIPTIASSVSNRLQSKLFVTINGVRLGPSPKKPLDADPKRPLYEVRVAPGLNRLEIEMIAGLVRGVPKLGPGVDVELEKTTLFLHLYL